MASIAKAFPFPDTVERSRSPGLALTNEIWWSPAWPFLSGLTGQTSHQAPEATRQALGLTLPITAKTVVGTLNFPGRLPTLKVCTTPAEGGQ